MFLITKTCRKTDKAPSRKAGLIMVAILSSICLSAGTASHGTPSLVTIQGSNIPESDMASVEKKLLQRTFDGDTVEKRLQRLELLVFGATQYGPVESRWADLKQNLAKAQKPKPPGTTAHKVPAAGQSQSLAEIEKHVLKKTNPALSTAQRLDQLESKVFGQTFPAVAVDQRIDRLRKTIGLADPGYSARTAVQPFEIVPGRAFSHRMFEPGNGFFMHQFDPQTTQMLEDMDRQMQEMQQFPNFGGVPMDGSQVHDFQSPDGNFRYHFEFRGPKDLREHVTPSQPKDQKGAPNAPKIPGLKTLPPGYVPPYGDPNSI